MSAPGQTLVDDDPGPVPATTPDDSPIPFMRGKFALYTTPDQGVVIVYRIEDSSEQKRLHIPPFIITMAGQASGLEPADVLRKLQEGEFGG